MSPSRPTIHVNAIGEAPELESGIVRRAVEMTTSEEGVDGGELSITFCGETLIRELNERYLGVDAPTDVIAFNLGTSQQEPLGDVYVCPSVARASAADLGVPAREELLRLVIHGTLHVLGYEHPDGDDRFESEMFRRQEEILAKVLE